MSKRLFMLCSIALSVMLFVCRIYTILMYTDGQTGALAFTNVITGALYVLLAAMVVTGVLLNRRIHKQGLRFDVITRPVAICMVGAGALLLFGSVWQLFEVYTGSEIQVGVVAAGFFSNELGAAITGAFQKGTFLLGAASGLVLIAYGYGILLNKKERYRLNAGWMLVPVLWAIFAMMFAFLEHAMIFNRPERLLPLLALVVAGYLLFSLARLGSGVQGQRGNKRVMLCCFFVLILAAASLLPPLFCSMIVKMNGYSFTEYKNLSVLAMGILAGGILFGCRSYYPQEETAEEETLCAEPDTDAQPQQE